MTRFTYAALIFGIAVSGAAGAQTPPVQLPPYLPAQRIGPPNLPDYLAPIEQKTFGPVQGAVLAADIEDATGGLLRAAGPVTVHTGPTAAGTIVSVPVVFAQQMQAGDGIDIHGTKMAPGERLYKWQYRARGDRTPFITVTAWCGQFRQSGLGGGHTVMCLSDLGDGRAQTYFAAQNPMQQALYAAWFASGLVDRNWDVIAWPKLTPVTTQTADMTLELVVRTGPKREPWFGWWLSKAGEKYPVLLNAGEQDGRAETIGETDDDQLIVPMRSQALMFTRDDAAGTVQLSGAVRP